MAICKNCSAELICTGKQDEVFEYAHVRDDSERACDKPEPLKLSRGVCNPHEYEELREEVYEEAMHNATIIMPWRIRKRCSDQKGPEFLVTGLKGEHLVCFDKQGHRQLIHWHHIHTYELEYGALWEHRKEILDCFWQELRRIATITVLDHDEKVSREDVKLAIRAVNEKII